jgi:hypothetical protein
MLAVSRYPPMVARATDALLATGLAIHRKPSTPEPLSPARMGSVHRINRPYYELLQEISKE